MSAYVVDQTHLDAILTAAFKLKRPGETVHWYALTPDRMEEIPHYLTLETADRIGAVLHAENVRSVNHRYGDAEPEQEVYEFNQLPGQPTPVQLLKLLACYEYQACEHPGWAASEAYRIVRQLQKLAIGKLPGFSDAPWSVSDSQGDVFLAAAR